MNFSIGKNSIDFELFDKEKFYFKKHYLKEANFDWAFFPPPHPCGSVIARLLHHFYYDLKEVNGPRSFPIRGIHSQGNFFCIPIKADQEIYVSPEYVAGFSGNIKNIHTKIKILPLKTFPTFVTLQRWFFSIYTGPGHVLVYTDSSFENTPNKILQPKRIVAFDITRRFKATPPGADKIASKIAQFLSYEVNMEFIDAGTTLCVNRASSSESGKPQSMWEYIKHILGFFRFA